MRVVTSPSGFIVGNEYIMPDVGGISPINGQFAFKFGLTGVEVYGSLLFFLDEKDLKRLKLELHTDTENTPFFKVDYLPDLTTTMIRVDIQLDYIVNYAKDNFTKDKTMHYKAPARHIDLRRW